MRTALVLLATLPAALPAQDRLVRRFGGEHDLVPPIVALAQDSVGFLWASTRVGLFRYDGARFRRWAPDALPRGVGTITVSPAGTVVVVDADGRILELTHDGARALDGAARRSPDHTRIATFDHSGSLWAIGPDGEIARRDASGAWRALAPIALEGDTARRLFSAGPHGGILVASGMGLWHVVPGSPPRRLLDDVLIVDALALDDHRIFALTVATELILIHPTAGVNVVSSGAPIPVTRGIALAERGGTVWIGTDRYLIALRPGGGAEVLGPQHEVVAGGPLLVDHEGSLWHGGFTALSQYPEPDTRLWNQRHGLRSDHTRFLARSRDVLWVTTWQGPTFLRRADGQWRAGADVAWGARGQLCRDGDGAVLVGTRAGVLRVQALVETTVNERTDLEFQMCRPASGGGFWIASAAGLHHLAGDGTSLTPVPSFPFPYDDTRVEAVLEDSAGRLWAASHDRICRARAEAVLAAQAIEWSCEPLPAGVVHLNSLVELAGGGLWAASTTLGVLHRTASGWQPLPDNARLPTRSLLNLVPSRGGGVWLIGAGVLQRVAARADGRGWRVLERPGAWHGLPAIGGGDLLEEDDGTLWITTSQGVIQVPGHVRAAEPPPPRMAPVEGRVDGQPVSLRSALVLPADRNRLELRFAALTFREPGRVRYQVRLSPGAEWTDTDGQPFFTWVDLPPGPHQPQVRATLDGETWSPQPAELAFRVLPAWYRTPGALIGFTVLAGALLFGLYRARLAYLLGLERQRTRIAMDLHDEMGSGLASIGILAGVLSDDGRAADGRRIAHEVAATAEELGTALSDIVWSLDPHSATLDELAARLAEHAARLFADDVQFDTDFPAHWPAQPLPLPVLRNVLLIGLEALHNAARHARAQRVVLGLRPDRRGWALTVRDDGAGLPPERTGDGRGRGLRTMRRRAAEIGGAIEWSSAPGGGTTVRLLFRLSPRRRRLFRWPRARPHPGSASTGSHEHASASSGAVVHR